MVKQVVRVMTSTSPSNGFELIFRVMAGFIMVYHGFGKVLDPMVLVPFLEMKGIPLPILGAYLAAYTEFLGGIALIIGAFTRIASLGLAICMAVAIFALGGFSAGLDSRSGGLEYQWLLLSLFTYFTISGAGVTSVDATLNKKFS